jgi:hypothetical protein
MRRFWRHGRGLSVEGVSYLDAPFSQLLGPKALFLLISGASLPFKGDLTIGNR